MWAEKQTFIRHYTVLKTHPTLTVLKQSSDTLRYRTAERVWGRLPILVVLLNAANSSLLPSHSQERQRADTVVEDFRLLEPFTEESQYIVCSLSVISSDEEEEPVTELHTLKSKVVKISNKRKMTREKMDKFSHLKNDPDFHKFLNEMLEGKLEEKRNETTKNLRWNAQRKTVILLSEVRILVVIIYNS